MRQKRAKTYRKLMHSYSLHFGFREPYQVLLDSSFTLSMSKQKIEESVKRVSDVVQGNAKLFITQCSMSVLYQQEKEGEHQKRAVQMAKQWERRMCNHREAIDEKECVTSVIGPTNKHRLVFASDQPRLRQKLRDSVPWLPQMHCNSTGVLVMEPMSDLTQKHAFRKEQEKLASAHREGSANAAAAAAATAALEAALAKADEKAGVSAESSTTASGSKPSAAGKQAPPPKKRKGPKQPNPLSMKKPKSKTKAPPPKAQAPPTAGSKRKRGEGEAEGGNAAAPPKGAPAASEGGAAAASSGKRKRRKRGKGEAQS